MKLLLIFGFLALTFPLWAESAVIPNDNVGFVREVESPVDARIVKRDINMASAVMPNNGHVKIGSGVFKRDVEAVLNSGIRAFGDKRDDTPGDGAETVA